jgi:hypothetical protein
LGIGRESCPQIFGHLGRTIRSTLCDNLTHAPQPIAFLVNHLIGASEQLRRHFEAERVRGLEIDHQLELVGVCTGRFAGLSPRKIRST